MTAKLHDHLPRLCRRIGSQGKNSVQPILDGRASRHSIHGTGADMVGTTLTDFLLGIAIFLIIVSWLAPALVGLAITIRWYSTGRLP